MDRRTPLYMNDGFDPDPVEVDTIFGVVLWGAALIVGGLIAAGLWLVVRWLQ